MMWLLIQLNEKKTETKYMCSKNYDKLIMYINTFVGVKKIDDYYFISEHNEFIIHMCEILDWRESVYDKHQESKKTWNLQKTKCKQTIISRNKKVGYKSK